MHQTEYYQGQSILFWALAALSEHENEVEKACYHYNQLFHHWEKTGDVHDILPGLGSAMSFFASHQLMQESNQCVQVLSSIANLTGNAEAVGTLSFALGEMAVLQGNFEEAHEHYAHAAEAFTELSIPLQLMLVQYKKGRFHAKTGEQKEALEALQQASQLAKSLGVRPMLAAITTQIEEVTGNMLVQTTQAGSTIVPAFALTERQVEILHALVDGLSNKEIASKLDLSTRTIDMHVRHLFDRLNCRTRAEAVRIALEKKLVAQPIE
jgi:ATP/maltotriose-dependent transcriptional regulator MalT